MTYWRQESFEALKHAKAALSHFPEFGDLIGYIDLLEKGLRKEGLKRIEPFLVSMAALPVDRQRMLASVLCREADKIFGHKLLPDSVTRRFTGPVIAAWRVAEPDNPEPLRWTGDLEDLIRAFELDPSCAETRIRLLRQIDDVIGFALHELPEAYLGNLQRDRRLLEIARRAASLVQSPQRETHFDTIAAAHAEIDAYLDRHAGKSG